MNKKLVFKKQSWGYTIYGPGTYIFGDERLTLLGRIKFREVFQNYGFYKCWNINSVGVSSLRQIVDKLDKLNKGVEK